MKTFGFKTGMQIWLFSCLCLIFSIGTAGEFVNAQTKSTPDPARGLEVILAGIRSGQVEKANANREKKPAEMPRLGVVSGIDGKELPAADSPIVDPAVQQVSCSRCGLLTPTTGGCTSCCGGTNCFPDPKICPTTQCGECCVPGRIHCCSFCEGADPITKCLCGVYHCICCPDPCYEPRWIGAANAAFWADSPRPVSQMSFRYNGFRNINNPDRAEYWVKKFNGANVPNRATFNQFHLFTETAAGGFSFFVDLPWRSVEYDNNNVEAGSGLSDMYLGTKSVLLDCELLLVTFQLTTYLPTGQAGKGLGTGHVSIEPAILSAIKLTPDLYFQCETGWWTPIAGTDPIASNIWYNHFSFNYVVYRVLPDVELIVTLEGVHKQVLDASFTDVNGNVQRSTEFFFHAGPGMRLNICNRIDFGVGSYFSLDNDQFVGEAVAAELRWRF